MNDERKAINKVVRLKRDTDKSIKTKLTEEQRKVQIKKWTTFYRRNIDIYAEERLRIKLRPFQRIMLHLMGRSQVWFGICSRASSKTFIVALFCVCVCLLKPYTEAVITASTIDQGRKMVEQKIKNELIKKLSPILKYLYEQGQIKIKASKDEVEVEFFNGSTIKVLPAMDSSRGARATILVYEECRLLKKGDVDSIFEPMLHPRQSIFLQKEGYSSDKDYYEEGISIYITSARYKAEWYFRLFKKVVVESFVNRKVPYNFFAADIYTSLKYGLKTEGEWAKIRKTSAESDVRMEYLNEAMGEVEDAYFPLELLKKCQRLHKAFRPPTDIEATSNRKSLNREKKHNETRILVVDFAFSTTTNKYEANDNTVIECMSGFYDKGEIVSNLDYLETLSGGQSELTQKRIRELFYDYKADYLLIDLRSGGEIYYNDLTKPYIHPARDKDRWDESGFTVVSDMKYHFLSEAKINELQSRTIDVKAKSVIIPIQGTPDFNDLMWRNLRSAMVDNKMRLLIDEIEFDNELVKRSDYYKMTNRERMLEKLPFTQTEFLVQEAIQLRKEIREGKIKLKEPRSFTKDRIVALGYGNMFFNKLENKLSKEDQVDDFDEEAWKNIIQV